MENVPGLWVFRINGTEFPLAGPPSFSPLHTSNEKVLDSSGRVVGNKQTVTQASISADVICVGKAFTKLVKLVASGNDNTAEFVANSIGEKYTLYGARQSGQLALNDHTCQVNLQGDTSNP
jgi:hypothetical protein